MENGDLPPLRAHGDVWSRLKLLRGVQGMSIGNTFRQRVGSDTRIFIEFKLGV